MQRSYTFGGGGHLLIEVGYSTEAQSKPVTMVSWLVLAEKFGIVINCGLTDKTSWISLIHTKQVTSESIEPAKQCHFHGGQAPRGGKGVIVRLYSWTPPLGLH